MTLTPVIAYTDGSCLGNPGPGGWGAILIKPNKEVKLCGFHPGVTTNNEMELTAVLKVLEALDEPSDVTIVADSTYVMMTKDKWKKLSGNPNWKNRDLWFQILLTCKNGGHKLHYLHVKAHSGDKRNEQCDCMAKEQAQKAKEKLQRRA